MKRLTIERCPGIELIVAFADQGEDHHGGIYQASNFVYTGTSEIVRLFKHKDTETILHNRAVSVNGYQSHFGHVGRVPRYDECEIIGGTRKHRYFLPLTLRMKEIALKMQKGYAKRATSDTSDTPGHQPGEGRAARDRGAPSDHYIELSSRKNQFNLRANGLRQARRPPEQR